MHTHRSVTESHSLLLCVLTPDAKKDRERKLQNKHNAINKYKERVEVDLRMKQTECTQFICFVGRHTNKQTDREKVVFELNEQAVRMK